MTPLQIFSQRVSNYFRTLPANIFLGDCFVEAGNSRLPVCSIREEEIVLQRCFGIFEILEHHFLSEHFLKSICNGGFSRLVGCRLQLCNFFNENCICFFWTFSKVFGATILHGFICSEVQQSSGLQTIQLCFNQKVATPETISSKFWT